jgi:hypothetical protein
MKVPSETATSVHQACGSIPILLSVWAVWVCPV